MTLDNIKHKRQLQHRQNVYDVFEAATLTEVLQHLADKLNGMVENLKKEKESAKEDTLNDVS